MRFGRYEVSVYWRIEPLANETHGLTHFSGPQLYQVGPRGQVLHIHTHTLRPGCHAG